MLVAIGLLASCSVGGDRAPDTSDESDAALLPTPADGSLFPNGDIDAGLAPWVESATADLASALGIDPSTVSTVSAVLVVWPDASLGCPEAGQQYATVLTDGAVIELAAGEAIYRFHAGGERGPFLCERPITAAPSRG